MYDFLRLFPRRPLLISVAGWAFFFAVQVGFLTYITVERYVPSSEPRPYDRLWFVYTQLPRMLPMAAVYAGCMVLVAQLFGGFMAADNPDNLTIGQWRKVLKDNPARATKHIGLLLIAILALVGILVESWTHIIPDWSVSILVGAAGFSLTYLFISSWISWVVRRGTSSSPDGGGETT